MMEALRDNDRRDAYSGSGVHPETGEKLSDPQHAKHVQWTKDTKAKLAHAQSTGDSKLANKLQRYLDMHGIDEDNNGAIASSGGDRFNSLDDQHQRAEDEHENLLHVRSFFGGKDFIGWAGDKMREIGKEAFEAKWETFIQDLEGNADDTGRTGLGSDRQADKWST